MLESKQIYSILRLAFLEIEKDLLGTQPAQNFARCYESKGNRFSASNIDIISTGDIAQAVMCSYPGAQSRSLDAALSELIGHEIVSECDEDEYYIDSIAVAQDHRGRGYFKQLLELAYSQAKNAGYSKLSLLAKNPAMYEKQGFKIIKQEQIAGEIYSKMIKPI